MEQKWPVRRTVILKISRRGLVLRAAFLLAVIASVCAVGMLPWPGRREMSRPKWGDFGVGARFVPSILPVSLENGWVSSPFGIRVHPITGKKRMHYGIDLAVDEGVPVKAAADGKVIFARDAKGYGKLVEIDHGNGIETRYAHNSAIKVEQGDFVRRGQVIALAGHTGQATGDHLHYEVRVGGKPVNPRKYLPALPARSGPPGSERSNIAESDSQSRAQPRSGVEGDRGRHPK